MKMYDEMDRQTDGGSNAGFEILASVLAEEARRNRIRALVTMDKRQRLIYEIKALEAKRDLQKMIAKEKGTTPKGILADCVSRLAQKYSILADLTTCKAEKAELQRKAEQYKIDVKRMKEAK